MPIIFLNFRKPGNRGSDKITRPTNSSEVNPVVATTSFTPQQSTRSFVAPTTGVVKKSISIKTVIEDPKTPTHIPVAKSVSPEPLIETLLPTVEPQDVATDNVITSTPIIELSQVDEQPLVVEEEPVVEKIQVAEEINTVNNIPIAEEKQIADETQLLEESKVVEEKNDIEETQDPIQEDTVETEHELNADFLTPWLAVVELLFNKTPAVYATLKTRIPEINLHRVVISIANSYQKDLIKARQSEILHYLKENYSISLEEIEIVEDQLPDKKLVVMDNTEKIRELNRQNNSLPDFLKILNLNLKE
ncbi:MAG: hypothetical protein LBU51_05720 [Bacteroidales bacterium]|jgi:hypothetical protein|nr:hypothetical protein [Bacteroidales bacterium]